MKWSKDYRTGEVVTEKAYKPDNLKGKATIQLRDKDGNIIHETVSENIIIPPISSIQNSYYELCYQSLMPSSSGAAGIIYNGSSPYGFGGIILSDNADMESEENMFLKGNVIGWCPRTDQNAGSDTTRGVYNPTESYVECADGYYHAHLVYDFGTSQGNGEFSSIWWTPLTYDASYYKEALPLPFKAMNYQLKYRKNNVGVYGNHLRNALGQVCKYDGGYKAILNYKNAINGIEDPVYDANVGVAGGNRSGRFAYGDFKYSTGYDSTNFGSYVSLNDMKQVEITFKRYEAALEEPVAVKTVNLWNELPEIADCFQRCYDAGRSSCEISFDPLFTDDDGVMWGYLHCNAGSTSTSYYKFPKISSTGEITPDSYYRAYFLLGYDCKNMTWKVKPGLTFESMNMPNNHSDLRSYTPTDKLKISEGKYVVLIGSTILYIADFNQMTYKSYAWGRFGLAGMWNTNYTLYCFDKFNNIIADSSSVGARLVRGYNAHTKLPNKVTKTSADTMKIQYDYYIQIPYAFTDDDNYIPPLT